MATTSLTREAREVVCGQEGAHGEIDEGLGQSARVTRDLLRLLPHAAAVLVVSRRRLLVSSPT